MMSFGDAPMRVIFPRRKHTDDTDAVTVRRPVRVTREILNGMVHLPISKAASRVGLCPTTFKKACRAVGIHVWPYRRGRQHQEANKIRAKTLMRERVEQSLSWDTSEHFNADNRRTDSRRSSAVTETDISELRSAPGNKADVDLSSSFSAVNLTAPATFALADAQRRSEQAAILRVASADDAQHTFPALVSEFHSSGPQFRRAASANDDFSRTDSTYSTDSFGLPVSSGQACCFGCAFCSGERSPSAMRYEEPHSAASCATTAPCEEPMFDPLFGFFAGDGLDVSAVLAEEPAQPKWYQPE
jgi:hypothetical protein